MMRLNEDPRFFEKEGEKLIRDELGNKKLTQEAAISIAKTILGDDYSVRMGNKTTVTDNGLTVSEDVDTDDFVKKFVYVYTKKEEKVFYNYVLEQKMEIVRLYRRESEKNDRNKEDLLNDVITQMTEKLDCRKCLKFDNNMGFDVYKQFDNVILTTKFEIEDGIIYTNGGCDPVRFLQDLIETVIKIQKGVMYYERI